MQETVKSDQNTAEVRTTGEKHSHTYREALSYLVGPPGRKHGGNEDS